MELVKDSLPEINCHHAHLYNRLVELGCYYSGVSTLFGVGGLWHLFYFRSRAEAERAAALIGAQWIMETTAGHIWRVTLKVA